MIHYSCDRCHRMIDCQREIRYSVRIEIQAVDDSTEPESVDDYDHLLALHDLLERLDETEADEIQQSVYQERRYDLCSQCHQQFLKNPLALDGTSHLEFSDN